MKQRRGPNTTKGKTPWAEEDKKEQEKEAEGSVEAIVDFKKKIEQEQVEIYLGLSGWVTKKNKTHGNL